MTIALYKFLRKAVNPYSWLRTMQRLKRMLYKVYWDNQLDKAWRVNGYTISSDGSQTLVADGMWYNPNHFLRLRIFIGSIILDRNIKLLGILRSKKDKHAKRALQRIGFNEFIYLEDEVDSSNNSSRDEAVKLLADVNNHEDFLSLSLPEGLPAYIIYDTVLKLSRNPQPTLNDPIWLASLEKALQYISIYKKILQSNDISYVVLSHPWKTEWGTLLWLAIRQKIACYHLTGYVEGIRIRRFRSEQDYYIPVEHVPYDYFNRLPTEVRSEIIKIGQDALAKRENSTGSDINMCYAYQPASRISDQYEARLNITGQTERPVIAIYGHVWFDFPHTFAMTNFTDFKDWIKVTLDCIYEIDDVVWLLKPHPTESWYGGFYLADLVKNPPSHVKLLQNNIDNKTVLNGVDGVITVHGTVGLEAVAHGLPVILADRSYFSNWGFAYQAQSRDDYLKLLKSTKSLCKPTKEQQNLARAAFALSLAEPPGEANALTIRCDSSGILLYKDIISRLHSSGKFMEEEQKRVYRFIKQSDVDSFGAFYVIQAAHKRLEATIVSGA